MSLKERSPPLEALIVNHVCLVQRKCIDIMGNDKYGH